MMPFNSPILLFAFDNNYNVSTSFKSMDKGSLNIQSPRAFIISVFTHVHNTCLTFLFFYTR